LNFSNLKNIKFCKFRSEKVKEYEEKTTDERLSVMEKKLSMEEKKFRTLHDEYREVNKSYQAAKIELIEQKELNVKFDGQIKLLQEDVDRKIEEATGLPINAKILTKISTTVLVLRIHHFYSFLRTHINA